MAFAPEQVGEMGEGCEGRRSFLVPDRWCRFGCISYQVPLVFIVMAVETEQLPVAPIERVVVMVVVFVVDGELVQLFAVKFSATMRTNPREKFEGKGPIRLFAMKRGAPCHESLRIIG